MIAKNAAETRKEKAMKSRGKPFTKGNPGGGRKPLPPDLYEACRAESLTALDVLKKILINPESRDADRIRSAEIILNRAYGTPAASVEILGPQDQTPCKFVFVDPPAKTER